MTFRNRVRQEILELGRVSVEIKEKYFPTDSFEEIRDKLEELGIDRHTAIELESVEIALLTPFGVLMQIRPSDKDQLGMWGGVMEVGETPEEAAIRELQEETGITITKDQLIFVEQNPHFHEYANGDKAYFVSNRFIVKFDYVPKIVTDEESVGAVMVVHTILSHQQNFIKRVLGELHSSL